MHVFKNGSEAKVWLRDFSIAVNIGYSARELNVEAYPDPTPPLVEVISQSPGFSPEEMEAILLGSKWVAKGDASSGDI